MGALTQEARELSDKYGETSVAEKQVPELAKELVTPGSEVTFYQGQVVISDTPDKAIPKHLLLAPAKHAPTIDPASIDLSPGGHIILANPVMVQGPDGGTYYMGLEENNTQPNQIQLVFVSSEDQVGLSHEPTQSTSPTQKGTIMNPHIIKTPSGNGFYAQAETPDHQALSIAAVVHQHA